VGDAGYGRLNQREICTRSGRVWGDSTRAVWETRPPTLASGHGCLIVDGYGVTVAAGDADRWRGGCPTSSRHTHPGLIQDPGRFSFSLDIRGPWRQAELEPASGPTGERPPAEHRGSTAGPRRYEMRFRPLLG
jgi:hypothetical protein